MSALDAGAAGATEEEAAQAQTAPARSLSGEKAQRIIDAMRTSVARRGTAGSTFDHVSREAGVSRGLLHYYFGTKEQLLVEAVRHDANLRLQALEQQLATAQSADDFIALMASNLQETIDVNPDFVTLVFELFTLARRNDEIKAEFAELARRMRERLAHVLSDANDAKLLRLHADPDAVAEMLFAMADGLSLRLLSEPERDHTPALEAAISAARALLTD